MCLFLSNTNTFFFFTFSSYKLMNWLMDCAHKWNKMINWFEPINVHAITLKLRIEKHVNPACRHTKFLRKQWLCSWLYVVTCDVYACVVSLFPMLFQALQSPLTQPLPSHSLRIPRFTRVQSLPVSPNTVPPHLPTQKNSAAKMVLLANVYI